MRSQVIQINGKACEVKEYKIKQLRDEVLPKIEPAWKEIVQGDIAEMVDKFGEQLKSIFPELKDVDIDDCYPSEIEAFVEAWIDANFTGLKRLLKPVMSLMNVGRQVQGLGLVKPLDNPTTGKN